MEYIEQVENLKQLSKLYKSKFEQSKAIFTQSNPFTQSLFGDNSGVSIAINYARIGVGESKYIDFLPICFGSTQWSKGLEIEMLDTQREEHIRLKQYLNRDTFDLLGLSIPTTMSWYQATLESIDSNKNNIPQHSIISNDVESTLELLQAKRFERLDTILKNIESSLEFGPDLVLHDYWSNMKMYLD